MRNMINGKRRLIDPAVRAIVDEVGVELQEIRREIKIAADSVDAIKELREAVEANQVDLTGFAAAIESLAAAVSRSNEVAAQQSATLEKLVKAMAETKKKRKRTAEGTQDGVPFKITISEE